MQDCMLEPFIYSDLSNNVLRELISDIYRYSFISDLLVCSGLTID